MNNSKINILVTGGSGFIGSNFIHYLLEKKDHSVLNVDCLTYAGNEKNNTLFLNNPNYKFFKADISSSSEIKRILEKNKVDFLVNFAAESHVDRSIDSPTDFLKTNVFGTFNLLKLSKELLCGNKKFRFLHVSTDEVYGTLKADEESFTELNQYAPNSPYSASKASSDHFVRAWFHTYNLPVLTTNCSNNYGPFQYPEKLIPLTILNAILGKKIPIYGDGKNIRDWLYVKDHCDAIYRVITNGKIGEVYNIGGNNEKTNLEVVSTICNILDDLYPISKNINIPKNLKKYSDLITFVKDRAGHDFRYSINSSKINDELGWKPKETFDSGIKKTVSWYLDNQNWLNNILDKLK